VSHSIAGSQRRKHSSSPASHQAHLPSIGVLGSGLLANTTSTYSNWSLSRDALRPEGQKSKSTVKNGVLHIPIFPFGAATGIHIIHCSFKLVLHKSLRNEEL